MARRRRVKRILNCDPSRLQDQDWSVDHAKEAGAIAAAPAIPSSKDLRAAWWTVGNQGDTGACVGWASADGALRWHFVKAGLIKKTDRLSPRFLWMAAKETDDFKAQPTTFIDLDGTTIKAALDVSRKYGAVKEKVLPFTSGKLYGKDVKSFYALAAQLKITSYYNLKLDLTHIKAWLANSGPVLVRVVVDGTWRDANTKATSNLDVYDAKSADEGHAVVLVGYTPDRFIIRNSWGTTWGDRGFAYASLAYAEKAFTESYGVVLNK